MKNYYTTIIALLSILVTACGTTPKNASTALNHPLVQSMTSIEQSSANSAQFRYVDNEDVYTVYFTGNYISWIDVKDSHGISKLYYQNGQLFAIHNSSGYYQFNDNTLAEAFNLQGKSMQVDPQQQKMLIQNAEWLNKKLAINKVEREIDKVKTGAEAKLNYLCIAKVQQVYDTKRVFRSSNNRDGNSVTRLNAEMRLNGNQFYNMICETNGQRVTQLSLIKR